MKTIAAKIAVVAAVSFVVWISFCHGQERQRYMDLDRQEVTARA